jgi:NitT/TauT family transport system ATP-binding protein
MPVAGAESTGSAITLRAASMTYASGLRALEPIDLDIAAGEFISIVGPSGCGKSTLLRIVAGLLRPSSGTCAKSYDGVAAFVFQEPALLPWLNVAKNAELLMELEGVPAEARKPRAADALRIVGLAGFEREYPHQLSGGMRMRLSLARSVALGPRLLLLDEPLAAVDELTREVLQDELLQMWSDAGFTALFVTHNVQEAVYLSTRVLVMSERPGRILESIDVPFAYPRTPELRGTEAFAQLTATISRTLRARSRA